MTYRELCNRLKELSYKQLGFDITIKTGDEYHLGDFCIDNETDVLDTGHPYLMAQEPLQGYVTYDGSNYDGIITPEGWDHLAKAGWKIEKRHDGQVFTAQRFGLNLKEAVDEWKHTLDMSTTDIGYNHQPAHSFTEYDADDHYIASGPSVAYNCTF